MNEPVKPMPNILITVPVFLVDDIVKSAEWYRDVLGFQFDRFWGEPPCFVMVGRDEAEIFLSGPETPGEKIMRPNRKVTHAWDAYIRVRDVAALCAEFKAKGAREWFAARKTPSTTCASSKWKTLTATPFASARTSNRKSKTLRTSAASKKGEGHCFRGLVSSPSVAGV